MTVYRDQGNRFVAENIPSDCRRLLDIGCGSANTSSLLKADRPELRIEGITFNSREADSAASVLDAVHLFDIESDEYPDLRSDYDCLLFSHVLEHVKSPSDTLTRFLSHLVVDGYVVVAVPNVLEWRTRASFALGRWNYTDGGILDRTHLRFFTYESLLHELLNDELRSRLEILKQVGHGSVPLAPLRGFLPDAVSRRLDRLGVRLAPNLFAQQTLVLLRKRA